jgi:hypothetical protein
MSAVVVARFTVMPVLAPLAPSTEKSMVSTPVPPST